MKKRTAGLTTLALLGLCITTSPLVAQSPSAALPNNVHPLIRDSLPPGHIGAIQLQRKPDLRGVWQAVELKCPPGVRVGMADAGQFTDDLSEARLAVMVGSVYRMRLTGGLLEDEVALYPTLEIIDRTYPPPEREHRFPVPIELDEEDLVAASQGEMIMKVIYVEDNQIADPIDTAGHPQRVLDLTATQDALQTADQMGRPIAILRIGSRVPNVTEGQDWDNFLYGCPAWVTLKPIPTREMLIEQGRWPATVENVPRTNLGRDTQQRVQSASNANSNRGSLSDLR